MLWAGGGLSMDTTTTAKGLTYRSIQLRGRKMEAQELTPGQYTSLSDGSEGFHAQKMMMLKHSNAVPLPSTYTTTAEPGQAVSMRAVLCEYTTEGEAWLLYTSCRTL